MKGRHQFRRRFSLQPSFLKDNFDEERHPNHRSHQSEDEETRTDGDAAASNNIRHKIVVMGGAKVGKSSLITQFLYGSFSPKYKRTVEEMHHGNFDLNGTHLTLEILDTSGAYEFPAMRALSISSGEAFILVYDVADAGTFEEARMLREQIHETKGSTAVPIVVVGNKTDLGDQREVDTATTESVVTVDWENGFVETSAKDNVNVTQVFKELLHQAKIKYNLSPVLRRQRRQSLPSGAGHPHLMASHSNHHHHHQPHHPMVPSSTQIEHLQQIRDRHSKRNSCTVS